MLIESIIRRAGGTQVALVHPDSKKGTKVEYDFKPQPSTGLAHVCPVKISAHIETFLAIPEGYRKYGSEEEETLDMGDASIDPPMEPVVTTSTDQADDDDIEPGFPDDETNETEELEMSDAEPEGIDEAPDDTDDGDDGAAAAASDADGTPDDGDGRTLEELRAAFETKFGKAPHHRAGREKILEQLNAPEDE